MPSTRDNLSKMNDDDQETTIVILPDSDPLLPESHPMDVDTPSTEGMDRLQAAETPEQQLDGGRFGTLPFNLPSPGSSVDFPSRIISPELHLSERVLSPLLPFAEPIFLRTSPRAPSLSLPPESIIGIPLPRFEFDVPTKSASPEPPTLHSPQPQKVVLPLPRASAPMKSDAPTSPTRQRQSLPLPRRSVSSNVPATALAPTPAAILHLPDLPVTPSRSSTLAKASDFGSPLTPLTSSSSGSPGHSALPRSPTVVPMKRRRSERASSGRDKRRALETGRGMKTKGGKQKQRHSRPTGRSGATLTLPRLKIKPVANIWPPKDAFTVGGVQREVSHHAVAC